MHLSDHNKNVGLVAVIYENKEAAWKVGYAQAQIREISIICISTSRQEVYHR